jgi:hypothetical protein
LMAGTKLSGALPQPFIDMLGRRLKCNCHEIVKS